MSRSVAATAAALLLVGSLLSAQQAEAGMQDIDRQCKKVLAFFALQTTTIDGALQRGCAASAHLAGSTSSV